MPSDTIESEWHYYERRVLDPAGAGLSLRRECRRAFHAGASGDAASSYPRSSRRECRRAFWAGATAMLELIAQSSAGADEDVANDRIDRLYKELAGFALALQDGMA